MNLSTIIFVALTSFFSSNLIAQSSFNDYATVNFSTHNSTDISSDDSFDKTSMFTIAQINDLLSKKFVYPASMRTYNIEGISKVSFTLTNTGRLIDIIILESLGSEFDHEIKRVLSSIDTINPIKVNGKAISQKIVLPIQFEI